MAKQLRTAAKAKKIKKINKNNPEKKINTETNRTYMKLRAPPVRSKSALSSYTHSLTDSFLLSLSSVSTISHCEPQNGRVGASFGIRIFFIFRTRNSDLKCSLKAMSDLEN